MSGKDYLRDSGIQKGIAEALDVPETRMIHDPFPGLPDDARLWVVVLDRPLDGSAAEAFREDLRKLLEGWRHKGKVYEAAWQLWENQLLLVAEPNMAGNPSGCAIDGMLRKLERIASGAGVRLATDQEVVVRTERGLEIYCRTSLPCLLQNGRLAAHTCLVDRSLHNLSQLRQGRLERPLADTWIGHKYGLAIPRL